jgi:hypothetical protein
VKFAGVYPHHGSLQRYKVHPARWVHRSVCASFRSGRAY